MWSLCMGLAAGAGGDIDPMVQRRGLIHRSPHPHRPATCQMNGTGHKASAEGVWDFWVPGSFIPLSPKLAAFPVAMATAEQGLEGGHVY